MSRPSQQAWRDFSANSACLEARSADIHSRYQNKWIGIYKGQIESVADSFDEAAAELTNKNIPLSEALVRFIGQKEMTLIL